MNQCRHQRFRSRWGEQRRGQGWGYMHHSMQSAWASQPIYDATNTGSPPVMELPAGHLPVPPHDVTVPLASGIHHNWEVLTETRDDNNIEGFSNVSMPYPTSPEVYFDNDDLIVLPPYDTDPNDLLLDDIEEPDDITHSSYWPVSEKLSKVLMISPLPGHLECEICLDVLSDPVQTSCCGQGYCKSCISKVRNNVCPHCRAVLECFPDKKTLRIINDLQIKCPYHIQNKCLWRGCLSELQYHLKNCDIKPITCSLGCGELFEKKNEVTHVLYLCSFRKVSCKYCRKQIMDKDMVKHHEKCPKMPILCPNKCCSNEKILRESLKEHIEVCPEHLVMCKYFKFGCNKTLIKRKDYDQHLSSEMEQHLHLVAEFAENESNARKMLEEKIATIERKLKVLSK